MTTALIPQVNIAPLFAEDRPARAAVDAAIFAAAQEIGFLTITGMPTPSAIDHTAKASLIRLFSLPEAKQRPLWKNNFEPANPNLYRGWFPLHSGPTLSREGYEIGPDIVRALPDHSDDLLYQPTPLPDEADLPGFKAVARAYFFGDGVDWPCAVGLIIEKPWDPRDDFFKRFRRWHLNVAIAAVSSAP